jgi:hypothetical protein
MKPRSLLIAPVLAALVLTLVGCSRSEPDEQSIVEIIKESRTDPSEELEEIGVRGLTSNESPGPEVPVPEEVADLAAQLEGDLGILLRGEAMTRERLNLLKRELPTYRSEQLEGLRMISWTGRGVGNDEHYAGLWVSNANPWPRLTGDTEVSDARIRMYDVSDTIQEWVLHHELAHHITENSRAHDFGTPFLDALMASHDHFPTEYAHTNDTENLAENVKVMRMGVRPDQEFLEGWRPSEEALSMFQSEFGFPARETRGPGA